MMRFLALLLLISSFLFAQTSFKPVNIAENEGRYVKQVFAEDFDGDGDLDVITTSWLDDFEPLMPMRYYENKRGSFVKPRIISPNPHCIEAIEDMDNDGNKDIVCSNFVTGHITIMVNQGNGNFSAPQKIDSIAKVYEVYVTDWDEDGKLDLIIPSVPDDELWLYKNNGSGQFPSRTSIASVDIGTRKAGIATGDVDNDGDIDLVMAIEGGCHLFRRKSDGSLDSPERQTSMYGANVLLVDTDKDGDLDIITHSGGDFRQLTNDGTGDFQFGARIDELIGEYGSLNVTDLDGNGSLDILLGQDETRYIRWYPRIQGNYADSTVRHIDTLYSNPFNYPVDFDNDGDMDVLSATESVGISGYVRLYMNDGQGNFSDPNTISRSLVDPIAIAIADLDNDGRNDVVSASRVDNTIAWYKNLGNEETGRSILISDQILAMNDLAAADMNGDGLPDIVTASGTGPEILWMTNNGSGNFSSPVVISSDTTDARSIQLIDLDKDMDVDVLIGSRLDSSVSWCENLGNGSFAPKAIITKNVLGVTNVYATDMDADGDIDVLSASEIDGKIVWFEHDGNGSFGAAQTISIQLNEPQSILAIDLDGDNDKDIVVASSLDNVIGWFENVSGVFSNRRVLTASAYEAKSISAGDLDRDGDVDIVYAAPGDSTIAWLENMGGGTFSAPIVLSNEEAGAASVIISNMSTAGDDDLDIISVATASQRITWFVNQLTPTSINSSLPQSISLSAFPNPSENGDVTLLAEEHQIERISLFDLAGRALPFKAKAMGKEFQISTSYRGMVVLKVQTTEGIWTEKIVFR